MKYSIDRFEGETAVLIAETGELHVPRCCFPPGILPGCIVEPDGQGGWTILVDETQDRRLRLLERRKKRMGDET